MVDFLIMYTIRDYYYIWVEIDNLILSSVIPKWPPYVVWKCSDITASFCLLRGTTVKQFEPLIKIFLYALI